MIANSAAPVAPNSVHCPSAPPANRFPAYPSAWYFFCSASELSRKPIVKRMLARDFVAYRTSRCEIVVMDARCSHLGADLGRGRVVNDCIQCPFHHWQYAADGRCVSIPHETAIPSFARQRVYPIVERHGMVFLFNGESPLFPLPFFLGERAEDFVAGRSFRFVADCSWFMLTANGFDTAHFEAVHDRQLLSPPIVDCPAAFARRTQFVSRVTGSSLADRFIRRTIGDVADVTITNWGGPLVAVTGRFSRAVSYILIMAQPLEPERTLVDVMVFAPHGTRGIIRDTYNWLTLEVRRWLTKAFLRNDFHRLSGIRYSPLTLIGSDRELVEFFQWVAALPQSNPGLPLVPAVPVNVPNLPHPLAERASL